MTGRRGSSEPTGPAPEPKSQGIIATIQAQFRTAARKLIGRPEGPKPKPRKRRGEGAGKTFAAAVRAVCRRCLHATVWQRNPHWDLSVWHGIWDYNEFSGLDFDCDYGYNETPTSSHLPAP